jgi:hypothetical protein
MVKPTGLHTAPIKDLMFVLSRNPMEVTLPAGYELLAKDEKRAFNLAPIGLDYCLFLAYTSSSLLMNWPITPLSSIISPQSAYGMVDEFLVSDSTK